MDTSAEALASLTHNPIVCNTIIRYSSSLHKTGLVVTVISTSYNNRSLINRSILFSKFSATSVKCWATLSSFFSTKSPTIFRSQDLSRTSHTRWHIQQNNLQYQFTNTVGIWILTTGHRYSEHNQTFLCPEFEWLKVTCFFNFLIPGLAFKQLFK